MTSAKRIIVSTVGGILCGALCYLLASSGAGSLPWPVSAQIVASRTLIGFAIGISCWRMHHWAIHGPVMGAVFSLPLAFSGLMAPESPEYDASYMFIGTVGLGMVYGLLVEVLASVIFKAKMR
jgi:uncharacterized membrane protein